MKSTRRHELQRNELADVIGHLMAFVKPNVQIIALAGAVVVLVLLAVIILPAIHGSTADLAAATFAAAQNAGDAPAVRTFLKDYPDSAQAPVARLLLADRILGDVVAGAKPEGDPLAEASRLYTQVAESSESLAPLARVGLALVTIQRGDLKKGREALQEVVSKWPQSIGAEKARAHIEALAGYEPVVFSDEPLEEPKPPDAEGSTTAEPKEGGAAKPPDAKPADVQPVPDAKPVPPPAGAEEKKESKPVG